MTYSSVLLFWCLRTARFPEKIRQQRDSQKDQRTEGLKFLMDHWWRSAVTVPALQDLIRPGGLIRFTSEWCCQVVGRGVAALQAGGGEQADFTRADPNS